MLFFDTQWRCEARHYSAPLVLWQSPLVSGGRTFEFYSFFEFINQRINRIAAAMIPAATPNLSRSFQRDAQAKMPKTASTASSAPTPINTTRTNFTTPEGVTDGLGSCS